MLASGLRRHDRLAEDRIHLLDQVPGALVGHLHAARRRRDRTERGDLLKQLDLARADAAVRVQVYPEAERWHLSPSLLVTLGPLDFSRSAALVAVALRLEPYAACRVATVEAD